MRENARQGSGETKTIRQHIFVTRNAKLFAKPVVAVKDLSDDRFCVWRVNVALFHRGTSRKPASSGDVLLQSLKVSRVILFHQAIAIGSGEVEDVARIFFKQHEIVPHRLGEVFLNDLWIFPAPFGIQMRITDNVERGLPRKIWARTICAWSVCLTFGTRWRRF